MTFWEHLDELRKRVIYSLISVFIISGIAYFFSEQIKVFLMGPINDIIKEKPNAELVYLSPQAPFILYLSIAIFSGVFISLPIIMYNFLKFIKPAVEKIKLIRFFLILLFSIMFFFAGTFFTYSVLIPFSLDFLISFAENERMYLSINSIVSLILWGCFCLGLIFQMPIIAYFLSSIGLIDSKTISKTRRYAFLISFILAAFITPPDVVSQIILALPIIALYELCIIIIKIRGKVE